MGLVDEEVEELGVGEVEAAAVEPYEERSLRTPGADAGDVLAAVVLHEAHVVLNVCQHRAAPGLTVFIGGDGGDRREECGLVHLVGLQPAEELGTYLLVRYYAVAADESCHVEGLGRGLEGDTVLACCLADGSEWNVLVSEDGHVAVYLITDDEDISLFAEVGESDECIAVPAYSGGVVGVAENEDAAFVVGYSFQVIEVHLVCAVVLTERVEHYLASVALRYESEGMVHRWLDDYFLIGLGEDVHYKAYALDDAGNERHPLTAYVPLMVVAYPVDDGCPELFRHDSVSEQ